MEKNQNKINDLKDDISNMQHNLMYEDDADGYRYILEDIIARQEELIKLLESGEVDVFHIKQ